MTKFRLRSEEREHAHYVVYAPRSKATRETLMNVAGRRWEIETGFEAAKGECGLDRYEMRRWQGRYRYITLALNGSCGTRHVAGAQQKTEGWVPLSVQEVHQLLCRILWRGACSIAHVLSWSAWRCRHRYRAQQCHYRRRECMLSVYLHLRP